tara:strand:+ start:840 stop:1850 length:1011 start_codon:yes stop_codon:yes gene_type:complete
MKDIVIYTDINPGRNYSISPSGLLEWIINFLNKKGYQYKIIDKLENLNKLHNKLIIIYPSHKIKELKEKFLLNNKIFLLGPDSNSVEAYSLAKDKLPILKLKIFKKIFIFCLIRYLDKHNLVKMGNTIVFGEEDYRYLKKIKSKTFFLPHPFLSSLNIKQPLSTKTPIDAIVLIGKLRGMPVGFKKIETIIEKYLLPIIENLNLRLYLFESTGLLLEKFQNHKNISIIKRNHELEIDFFQSKIMVNMSTCGAGTANRSLSSLHDGAFLFTTIFGARNISKSIFKEQLYISKYSPNSKLFFQDLENFMKKIKFADNRSQIINQNKISEDIFDKILKS